MSDDLHTRTSLLVRLRENASNRDWEIFYQQYGGVVLSFCRTQGLDEFHSRDVLQETMVLLIRKLPGFEYDATKGRFRSWLLTLVAGKARDSKRRVARAQWVALEEWDNTPPRGGGSPLSGMNEETGGGIERAWRHGLVEEALRLIHDDPRVRPETFAAFVAYAVEGKPVAQVAEQFKLQENAVYQIKNRLLRRVREEVQRLENLDALQRF